MKNNIIAYLLILLLPTIAGFAVYGAMQNILVQEGIREFESEVVEVAEYIDDQLAQSNALAKQLSQSRRVRNYQLSISHSTSEASYAAYEALGEFSSIQSTYNGISAFFVWFSKDDSILCASTRLFANDFFKYIYCTDHPEELLCYSLPGSLPHCEVRKPDNALDGVFIPYVVTLSLPHVNPGRYANLVVLLSVTKFENFVRKSELIQKGSLTVTDGDGNILFSIGEPLQKAEKTITVQSECSNRKITVCASVPKRVITDKSYSVRINFISMLLILFAVALGIALFSLFKNYRALRRTAEIFGDVESEKGILQMNLGTIYNAAKNITEREHTAQLELQMARPVLQDSLFSRILLGVEPTSRLEELGFTFTAASYSVGIMEPIYEGNFRVLSVALRELLHNCFEESILCTTDDEKNALLFLLCKYNARECEPYFHNIEEELGCKLRIYISAPFVTVDSVPRAFQQALLLRKRGTVSEGVYVYGVSEPGFRYFDYSLETEAQLVNRVRSGDMKCTETLLTDILFRNTQNGAITDENFKNSLVDTAINVLNELDRRCVSDTKVTSLFNDFLMENGVSERETQELFQYMAKLFEENNAKTGSVSSRVIEYVKNNFMDINCNVSTVAEVFHLNTSYLSSVFKSQTGENLSDYITGERIKLAKQMLLEYPDMPIARIAETVGFASETVLSRNFKKLTGVTPGKFKSLTKTVL